MISNNPFKEVKISVPRKIMERETKAFTSDEAETILLAALTYINGMTVDERARRWVPWLCAYTGARAGEITQLRGSDITKRGADYFAKLSPSAGKMKTRTARTVPLHEHLIEQGFLNFVHEVGSGPLFYNPPSPRRAGKPEPVQSPADRIRARIGDWVRSIGITDPELPQETLRESLMRYLAAYPEAPEPTKAKGLEASPVSPEGTSKARNQL